MSGSFERLPTKEELEDAKKRRECGELTGASGSWDPRRARPPREVSEYKEIPEAPERPEYKRIWESGMCQQSFCLKDLLDMVQADYLDLASIYLFYDDCGLSMEMIE